MSREVDGIKHCPRCNITKTVGQFGRFSQTPDGLYGWCRDCANARMRQLNAMKPPRVVTVSEKRCTLCGLIRPAESFPRAQKGIGGLHSHCRDCYNRRATEIRHDPERLRDHKVRRATEIGYRAKAIVLQAKKRCRTSGIRFDLSLEWATCRLQYGKCELSGVKFDLAACRGALTPSIDRINPHGGYEDSNCRMVLFALNMSLGNWGLEAFLPIAQALVAAFPDFHANPVRTADLRRRSNWSTMSVGVATRTSDRPQPLARLKANADVLGGATEPDHYGRGRRAMSRAKA